VSCVHPHGLLLIHWNLFFDAPHILNNYQEEIPSQSQGLFESCSMLGSPMTLESVYFLF
jgi:hypothetical protein